MVTVMMAAHVRTRLACEAAIMALVVMGGAPTAVHAQGATAPGELDVVVTARKREENLRDVPVSITALTSKTLTSAKINEMTDLVSNIPTLVVATGSVAPFVFVRGFGSGNNRAIEQSVGKFIDNVSYGRDQDVRLPLFDIERIEALKGPQVLLYGNSATAGALNITTRKPGSELTADINSTYEFRANEVVTQGGITVPLTDTLSVRASGYFADLSRGRVYNPLKGHREPTSRNWALRGIARYEPASGIEILLKGEYDHLRTDGEGGEIAVPPYAGPPIADTKLDNVRVSNENRAPFFSRDFANLNAELYQADINMDLLGGTLVSTTAYRKTLSGIQVELGEPNPALAVFALVGYNQFSQELRYTVSLGKIDLLAGGYYQRDNLHITSAIDTVSAMNVTAARVTTDDQRAKSLSGFGELTYHVSDALSIAAGARYSSISKDAILAFTPSLLTPGKTFATRRAEVVRPSGAPGARILPVGIDENHFQPQILAQYKFADKQQLYAKFVKGAKAGGIDASYGGNNVDEATFDAEKAKSWEVGMKGLVLDNNLEYSIAAFYSTFKGLQLSTYENSQFLVNNVGKARTQGVEVELNWRATSALRFNMTASYLDAEFVDFSGGTCNREQIRDTAAIRGTQPCRTGSFGVPTLAGVDTPYSSKWTGAFRATFDQPVGRDMIVTAYGALLVRSGYFSDTNNQPSIYQNGYAQIDASVDLHQKNDGFSAGVFVKNLTDKQYIENGATIQGGRTTGAIGAQLSRGRQIGIRAGYKF